MLLKTYRARDLAAALAAARAEMGAEALVLATSEIRGRLGLEGVEVTVGAPRAEASPAPETSSRKREGGAPSLDEVSRVADRGAGAPPPVTIPVLAAAVDALVASGLSSDLARRFAAIAGRDLRAGADAKALVAATARGIEGILGFAPFPVAARCLFVVGPPGCGKTTTAAKIAARLALGEGRKVLFAECDGERVGALEQAEIYTRHIGVTLARIEGPDDFQRALDDAGKRGIVVADTPGIGAADGERLHLLELLRGVAPDALMAVLLPSGLHRAEAARVLSRFAPLRPTCAALARVDDGGRPGELVSALAASGIPLAFVTHGHRIPDDLSPASAHGLGAMLLRAGRPSSPHSETHA